MSDATETFRLRSAGAWVLTGLVTIFGLALCYLVTFKTEAADVPRSLLPVIYLFTAVPVAILVIISRRLQRLGYITVGPAGFQHALAMRSPAPWSALGDLALEIRTHNPNGLQHIHGQRRAILHLSGADLRPFARVPLKDPTRLSVDVDGAALDGKRDVEILIASIERFKPVSRRSA